MKSVRQESNIQYPPVDEEGDVRGRARYLASYDLVPILEGRNLRYETRVGGKVQGTGQISIASAFRPGAG